MKPEEEKIFGFIIEEKFKLLNYTYAYIDKMYDDIANFPKKHEMIKKQLVKTSFELLEKISAGNYSHNKKYKKQMADEAVAKVKTLYFLLQTIEKNKMISTKMIHKLKTNRSYYERSERELARQSASIEAMISNIKPNSGTKVAVTTGFIKPISGPITSPFGYRIHPIFKSRIFHSGIDIGGPNGGAIRASNNGRVIYAGWYGGYGQVVILDHGIVRGQAITTLYAHMSSISVSKGQVVKQGQQVGREGSTGYSTGPHCHFEVRVNGQPRNPLNYI